MVMAEARHKLMPPHARPDEGLRLSKAQVKSAPVEQLRAWAQQAQIDRAAPKKRRSTPQPAPTVARLRQLVQAECCSTLPRWERRLFRAMAAEREEEVSPTEAHTKWRLSEVELIELRSGRPYAPLLLVDVVAKARQKFGGEAAFLDRKHKVRASKASLIKARTAEAQKELQRWRRREPMDWAEHAHAFRQYTHYGLMPNPRVITTQLVMARRKAAVVAELDSRGLDEKLVYTVSMRGYWDLSWWDAKRTGVGLQEAISRLMTTEAIKRTRIEQVAHVLESQRVPAEARQFVRANLMQYTEALW
ncbi:hypothetical protein MNEG_3947 [Monoraphidium neglectum]|uniref:Uncharacterized protein n=1 Tax=Monoraphidium neglectum TaxID=145388 RepID=A0A0D2LB81_9CHLO|nr:hypothetical protein MNEG_3947 [Monoraphidium neglectum]KIZ04009.1 hypothetical protein MNEG_3947 [Monoraphidium neglectum]|eukprot:XP_013903028.1 hypothetical protein MNEG_3947 [Monoraphidium neglectum]